MTATDAEVSLMATDNAPSGASTGEDGTVVVPALSRATRARWRQAKAVEMALAGSSFDDIALALDYSNRGAAWKAVQSGLRQATVAGARDYLALELARLDALQSAYWADAMQGKNTKAADLVMRIIAQRIRLLGLENVDAHGPRLGPTIVVQGTTEEYLAALERVS